MEKIKKERLEALAKNETEIGFLAKELLDYRANQDLPELQIGQHWLNSLGHHIIIGTIRIEKTKTLVTYISIYENVKHCGMNETYIEEIQNRLKTDKFDLVFDPGIINE